MKLELFLSICLVISLTNQLTEKVAAPKKERKLREDIDLITHKVINDETQEMVNFFIDTQNEHGKDNEAITITTYINSDYSSTTGNGDKIHDMELILPSYDSPVMDEEERIVTKEYQNYINKIVNVLSPDFFSEDPRMFLGDHDSYFKIVKKRSILFYYLSRAILYTTLIYIILKFIEGKKGNNESALKDTYSQKKFNCFVWIQMLSLALVIVGSIAIFLIIGEPKGLIDDAGSNLIYEFRNINSTTHNISELIDDLNDEKIKIPIDRFEIFTVNNAIKESFHDLDKDVELSNDFSINMLQNPYLTNYSIVLTIFFFGCLLFGISSASIVKKSPYFQVTLFLLSGLTLSYVVYNMGIFFANFSALHDICNSIIEVNDSEYIPEEGIGLIKYISCTKENLFFQQLLINLKAQNSAKKLFNNEMFKIHRDFIRNPEEGIRMSQYLKKIDASSVEIDSFATLLKTNKKIIYKLLSINKCNMIKEWLIESETKLCYNASSDLLLIFWILGLICIGFIGVNLSANMGSVVLEQYNHLNILKAHSFKKKRYANDIKLE